MFVGNQWYRDILITSLIIVGALIYFSGLDLYLSDLSNPLPLKFVLGASLLLSFFYDLKSGIKRDGFVLVAASALIFSAASFLSIDIREVYLAIIADLKNQPGAKELIGYEYVRAVENKAVGIGACFACALAVIRLPLKNLMVRLLTILLVTKEKRNRYCSSCGELIAKN